MRHSFADRYAYQDTPVHRLDGRAKLVVLLALILAAATTPVWAWWAFVGYGVFLGAVLAVARIPPRYVVTRWVAILPFVLLAASSAPFLGGGRVIWSARALGVTAQVSEHGLDVLANIVVRSGVCIVALVTLISVTPMAELLESLGRLRVPALLVMLAGFAYRYVFVLVDEVLRLKVARDSRSFGARGMLWHARVLGRMIASLFVRSFERAERVYAAMLSRGYDARASAASRPGLRLRSADVAFLVGGLAAVALLRSSELWLPKVL